MSYSPARICSSTTAWASCSLGRHAAHHPCLSHVDSACCAAPFLTEETSAGSQRSRSSSGAGATTDNSGGTRTEGTVDLVSSGDWPNTTAVIDLKTALIVVSVFVRIEMPHHCQAQIHLVDH